MKSPLEVPGAAPRIAVVAGHDPSGGAGVLADTDALRSAGASATLMVSAWTDQDEAGVRSLGARAPEQWLAEARAAARDVSFAALKLGLLPGPGHVQAAAEWIAELRAANPDLPVVVDPVLASSSGFRFVDEAGLAAYRELLAPLELVWTPNLVELAELAGLAHPGREDERTLGAEALLRLGALAVVVKGGHGGEDPVRELVHERTSSTWIEHPRIPGGFLRGSGCRHATTLAVELARGADLVAAARTAAGFVRRRIEAQPPPGDLPLPGQHPGFPRHDLPRRR